MSRHRRSFRFLFAGLLFCISGLVSVDAHAQTAEWSAPVDLAEGLAGRWFRPSIAADATGRLHAVWCGHTNPDPAKGSFATNAIYYVVREGAEWSDPVDIIYDEDGAYSPRLYVDDASYLHMYWSGSGRIHHGHAPMADARNARSWTVETVATGTSFDVAATGQTVHLVTVQEAVNVFYQMSDDAGLTWSPPGFVATVGDRSQYGIDIISVTFDAQRNIHIAWSVNAASLGWNGESLWYVRSTGNGQWAPPQVIDRNPTQPGWVADPKVAVDASGNIHLFWHRGIGHEDGRYHVWSSDGAMTWSAIKPSFPGHRGVTAPDSVVFDTAGLLHLIMSGAPPGDSVGRIFHSVWQNGEWSSLQVIGMGEHPCAALNCDGTLGVVWWMQPGIGYSESQIGKGAGECAPLGAATSEANQSMVDSPGVPKAFPIHDAAISPTTPSFSALAPNTPALGAQTASRRSAQSRPFTFAALAVVALLAGAFLLGRRH